MPVVLFIPANLPKKELSAPEEFDLPAEEPKKELPLPFVFCIPRQCAKEAIIACGGGESRLRTEEAVITPGLVLIARAIAEEAVVISCRVQRA